MGVDTSKALMGDLTTQGCGFQEPRTMSALQDQNSGRSRSASLPATAAGSCLVIPRKLPTAQSLNIYTDLMSKPGSARRTFPRACG